VACSHIIADYMIRGKKLDDMSLLNFSVNTYKSDHLHPCRGEIRAQTVPYLQGSCKGNPVVLRKSLSLAVGNPKMNISGYNTWKYEILT